MTDDDWAPLPLEQQLAHPGEQAIGKLPEPAATAAPATPPAPARQRTPPSEEGLLALQELQRRLHNTRSATSLIAEVQRHAQRHEQKRRAGAEPQLAATIVGAPPPVAAPAQFEIDEKLSDRDAREIEPWFLQLPANEQERLRGQWHKARHQYDGRGQMHRRRLARALGYGALLFFVMAVLQAPMLGGMQLVPALTFAGATAALFAECAGGGRFTYSIAGAIAFVVVMGPTILMMPFGLMSLMLATYGLGAIGMDGEMRRSGGFGDA